MILFSALFQNLSYVVRLIWCYIQILLRFTLFVSIFLQIFNFSLDLLVIHSHTATNIFFQFSLTFSLINSHNKTPLQHFIQSTIVKISPQNFQLFSHSIPFHFVILTDEWPIKIQKKSSSFEKLNAVSPRKISHGRNSNLSLSHPPHHLFLTVEETITEPRIGTTRTLVEITIKIGIRPRVRARAQWF